MKSGRIAILDLFSGISGDMLLGALLDLGADPDTICKAIESLELPGFKLQWDRHQSKGISCLKAKVEVKEEAHPHRRFSRYRKDCRKREPPSGDC